MGDWSTLILGLTEFNDAEGRTKFELNELKPTELYQIRIIGPGKHEGGTFELDAVRLRLIHDVIRRKLGIND